MFTNMFRASVEHDSYVHDHSCAYTVALYYRKQVAKKNKKNIPVRSSQRHVKYMSRPHHRLDVERRVVRPGDLHTTLGYK